MERTGCQEYNTKNLAETLKSQGNRAMQSELYFDAIELYNCDIALCENNAVYYCNRAAAYIQAHRYAEAARDCLKSIEIDPNYNKAYIRLGTAYFAQGNYADAINKGFKKALQLDLSNEVVKETIQYGVQVHQVNAIQISITSLLVGLEAMLFRLHSGLCHLMNIATNAYQGGQHSQNRQGEDGSTDGFDTPRIQIGGNMNLNFGEQMPGGADWGLEICNGDVLWCSTSCKFT